MATTDAEYKQELEKMHADLTAWRKAHPTTPILIEFKIPKGVFVIAAIQDAIDHGSVVMDDEARKMMTELGWLDDKPSMPTVGMVRAVLEWKTQPA